MPSAEQKESQMLPGNPAPLPATADGLEGDTDTVNRRPAEAGGKANPTGMLPPARVDHVNGIWRVTKHGRFYGDFLKEQHALSAGKKADGDATPHS